MNIANAKTAAFVTYNSLGIASGWHEVCGKRALVIQNTKGRGSVEEGNRKMTIDEVRAEIEKLWSELEKSLKELDIVVVYVGTSGAERAIELAAKLPHEKVLLVGCRCEMGLKQRMVEQAGLAKSQTMLCECGGHSTMALLIASFLDPDCSSN